MHKKIIPLEEFITEHFASKADFARQIGVLPQQVNTWLSKGYMASEDGYLIKEMRQLVEFE